jgi:YegS/Rv2252/BmrU family lipid kinase
MRAFLAVINRAAGGGRCGKMVDSALARLRSAGVQFDPVETERPGHASELARIAYRQGYRRFIAIGGDGTSHEIINGLFPEALSGERPMLGFLPLGTGNSFLRDFTDRGLERAFEAIIKQARRPCDIIRLTHKAGAIHYMNILSMGFPADVAALVNRRFKHLGQVGYLLGVLICLLRLEGRAFPLSFDREDRIDDSRCLLLTFNNSKFTGGKMMLAPHADPADGLIECVRWEPVGRIELIRNLPGLYTGAHINKPKASRRAARRVDFYLDGPVDLMVDGEVLRLHCESLEVLPSAIDVMV